MDHRVPFEVGGDPDELLIKDWMLLSGSANMNKKQACSECDNMAKRDVKLCKSCYWASPEKYNHVSGVKQQVVTMLFRGEEDAVMIDSLTKLAKEDDTSVNEIIKRILNYSFSDFIEDSD